MLATSWVSKYRLSIRNIADPTKSSRKLTIGVPYTNANSPGLTLIRPPIRQAEADTELTLSTSAATAVAQLTLTNPGELAL